MATDNDPRPLQEGDPRRWVMLVACHAMMFRETMPDWAYRHPAAEWAEVDEAAAALEVALDHLDRALAGDREPVLTGLHGTFPPGWYTPTRALAVLAPSAER